MKRYNYCIICPYTKADDCMIEWSTGEYVQYKDHQETYGGLLDILHDVIKTACTDTDDKLDSMAMTSYAEAMRLLAEHGRIKIKSEYGRRVIAENV